MQEGGSWGVTGTVRVHEGGGGVLCRMGVPGRFLGRFLCRKGGGGS